MFKTKVKNNCKWKNLFGGIDDWLEEKLKTPKVAEEILSKNIFRDEALEKMGPDYIPPDIFLRMEVKRSIASVKGFRAGKVTDKINKNKFKRDKNIKDLSRISRELLEVKRNFKKNNIRNKIMIKHARSQTKVSKQIPEKSDDRYLKETRLSPPLNDSINSNKGDPENTKNILALNTQEEYVIKEKITVNNSDEIEDIETAVTLMKLYSDSVTDDILTYKENVEDNISCKENIKPDVKTETDIKIIQSEEFIQIISLSNIARIKFLEIKYFSKWRQFTETRKSMTELRKKKLNDFFERLMKQKCELNKRNSMPNNEITKKRKDKANSLAHDQSTYQHRYQMQKNIIALQKLKLQEKNRIIEELKYNKIVEATKESTESIKDTLKNINNDLDRQMRPKIKNLTNELNLRQIEDPALVLHCLKVPQFLQRMEKRAREREEKHAVIRERRRQMEEEKLRIKQQAELAKAEMDKEEKERRIQELKEKRRQEKIEFIRRKRFEERLRGLTVMADLHYEKTLKTRCGIKPWIKLLKIKRENEEKAERHYEMSLKRKFFMHWMWHTDDMLMERNYIAEEFCRKKLLRKAFDAFKLNHKSLVLKQQVADDYYDYFVQRLIFRKFRHNIDLIKREGHLKWEKAVKYYESTLMFRALTHWRVLPALNKLQRERDARKTRWRQKVLLVVPDYKPPDN